MQDFKLDERLARDCLPLGRMDDLLVLLMDNRLVPWLVLVPRAPATELCDLSPGQARALARATEGICAFLRARYRPDKLNVAAIGNVVAQLHLHVVGRFVDDFCWPGVVWGRPEREPYDTGAVTEFRAALAAHLGDAFLPLTLS